MMQLRSLLKASNSTRPSSTTIRIKTTFWYWNQTISFRTRPLSTTIRIRIICLWVIHRLFWFIGRVICYMKKSHIKVVALVWDWFYYSDILMFCSVLFGPLLSYFIKQKLLFLTSGRNHRVPWPCLRQGSLSAFSRCHSCQMAWQVPSLPSWMDPVASALRYWRGRCCRIR